MQCQFLLGIADDAELPYTALSYTWGTATSESDVVRILLHGQDFVIRTNLWSYLRRARQDPMLCNKLYWIDALCIDQTENGVEGHREKNHQVNMMCHIYSNACEVVCWLGDPDTNLSKVNRDLEALGRHLINRKCMAEKECKQERQWALSGLLYIMQLKYWSRIWIVQEVVLAREAVIRCGDFAYSWDDILSLRKSLEIRRSIDTRTSLDDQLDWSESEPIAVWCMEKALGRRHSIMDALYDFRNHDCSDRRDRIYALLGLFPFAPVEADYNKSCAELYIEFLTAAPQCGQFFFGPLDRRAERTKCYFPTALARALRLTDEDKGKVHARLTTDRGVDWEKVHHAGAECRLKGKFERDKMPVPRRRLNGELPMV